MGKENIVTDVIRFYIPRTLLLSGKKIQVRIFWGFGLNPTSAIVMCNIQIVVTIQTATVLKSQSWKHPLNVT